jgi:hypothetical protein
MTTETQTPGTAAAADPAATTASAAQPEGTGTPQTGTPASASQTDAKEPAPSDPKPGEGEPKPVEYADFTVPEGVKLNDAVVGDLKAFAKSKGLTQDEAQQLVDLGIKNAQNQHATLVDQIAQQQASWIEAARIDKEIGGDKLDENRALSKRALDAFGTPELTKMLDESKLGDHPEILRAFYRVGKAISEDRLVAGSTKPTASKPFYSNSNHTQ